MATTAPLLACPQGHGPGVPGAQFCTTCGSRLVAASVPVNAPAVIPIPPPQPPAMPAPQATPAFAPVPSQSAAPAFTPVPTPAFTPVPAQTAASAFTPVAPAASQPLIPPPMPAPALSANGQPVCRLCGSVGNGLDPSINVCPQCAWLRPLLPGYQLDRQLFLWAQDGQAMSKLQKISALHTAVRTVSDKVGRPWIESTFNGIRLGPKQFPDVWALSVLAARVLGLPTMPDVYISGGSGSSMWNTYTFGSDQSCFIVLGTAILNNFTGDDLFFVLAREMGHVRAGHALWKTLTHLLAGDTSAQGILANGILHAISPSKLIEGTIELPLLAWSRQADITADRAGLLAVGDENLARRVLLAWSIRSNRLLKEVNIEEWMKQEGASDDQLTRFSEMTTSSSMYTTRRLRLLGQSAQEPGLMRWGQSIQPVRKRLTPPPRPKPAPHPAQAASAPRPIAPRPPAAVPLPPEPAAPQPAATPAAGAARPAQPASSAPAVRVLCTKCKTPVRIPLAVLRGRSFLNVRCPQCKNIFTIRPKSPAPSATPAPTAPPASASTPAPAGAASPSAAPTAKAVPQKRAGRK